MPLPRRPFIWSSTLITLDASAGYDAVNQLGQTIWWQDSSPKMRDLYEKSARQRPRLRFKAFLYRSGKLAKPLRPAGELQRLLLQPVGFALPQRFGLRCLCASIEVDQASIFVMAREHKRHVPEHYGVVLQKLNMLLYGVPIMEMYCSRADSEAALL